MASSRLSSAVIYIEHDRVSGRAFVYKHKESSLRDYLAAQQYAERLLRTVDTSAGPVIVDVDGYHIIEDLRQRACCRSALLC